MIIMIPSSSDPEFPKGLKSSSPAELSSESGSATKVCSSLTMFLHQLASLLLLSSESLSDPLLTESIKQIHIKLQHIENILYQLGHVWLYSQSTSHVTSISKNEMNIQIPLCNVRHLNGILNISLEIFPKKRH